MSGHYVVRIEVTKVEFQDVMQGRRTHPTDPANKVDTRRIVSDAGKIEIKNTDFDTAKDLAAKHLELLAEFDGTDPRKGNTRD
jgi:hypothetical protein